MRSPVAEFLATGGLTFVLLPLGWLIRLTFGLQSADLAFGFTMFYAAYVVNDPHFAATYLLFYRRAVTRLRSIDTPREERARLFFAGVIAPLGLVVASTLALHARSAEALGMLVQGMFALVGWHYAKQGFGVFAVLTRRRGGAVSLQLRRALLFHAYAGWAFAWANPSSPRGVYEEKGVVYHALAHPRWFEILTASALGLSTVLLAYRLVLDVVEARHEKSLRWCDAGAAPLAGFLVTIWSWTIFSSIDPLLRYAIPFLHSVQYLYFVWLIRRNEARAEEGPPTFGRPARTRVVVLALSSLALGWLLFRGVPTILDEALGPSRRNPWPAALGPTPFFAAFFVVVNIHHYVMDSVLWRRENPDMRWLTAPDQSTVVAVDRQLVHANAQGLATRISEPSL